MRREKGRHAAFFKAAVEFQGMGLSLNEVERHLLEIETHIGKTQEQWTKYAMKTLERYQKSCLKGIIKMEEDNDNRAFFEKIDDKLFKELISYVDTEKYMEFNIMRLVKKLRN